MPQFTITTQRQLRAAFWREHPDLVRRPGGQNAQPTDTRVAFVDYVEHLARLGAIPETLAQRATL